MNKDNLRNLLLAGAVFIVVLAIGPRLLPPPPPPPPSTSTQPTSVEPAQAPSSESKPPGTPTLPTPATASGWTVVEAPEAQTIEIGAKEAAVVAKNQPPSPYRMHLRLSNIGASIESATLTDHAATLKGHERYQLLSLIERPGGTSFRSFAIEKINIDGEDVPLRTRRWTLGKHEEGQLPGGGTGETAEFHLDLQKGDTPGVRLTRTYVLPQQPVELGRHDLDVRIKVENLSNQQHRALISFSGGIGIQPINPRMDDRAIDFATVNSAAYITAARQTIPAVASAPDLTLPLFTMSPANPDQYLAWAAIDNTYFTCTLAPLAPNGTDLGKYIVSVVAIDADRDAITNDDVTLRFTTAEALITPANSIDFPASAYLGEKNGNTFRKQADYVARNYYFQISQGFGICTFSWLVELMIFLLNGLHKIIPDYGVAIIILVLIVRALLHPITKKGQVNMVRMQHRMQTLQPKIEEIKRKYANDKVRMNQEMMKLDLNPAGQLMTCIPMLIQMPIWVALYLSLSNNIEMRHQPFLFTWIHDLTAPDALIHFKSPIVIPIVGWHITSFNLLPLLLTVFTYTQQKLQPKPAQSPNMTDQQRQQQETMQRMIPIMSLMMLFIFYNAPSGLTLYVMASSLFGTIEQWWIRKHIKEREAAGTLHKNPDKKDGDGLGAQIRKMKPSWVQRIQKMAEEAQKAQHTQRARPKR